MILPPGSCFLGKYFSEFSGVFFRVFSEFVWSIVLNFENFPGFSRNFFLGFRIFFWLFPNFSDFLTFKKNFTFGVFFLQDFEYFSSEFCPGSWILGFRPFPTMPVVALDGQTLLYFRGFLSCTTCLSAQYSTVHHITCLSPHASCASPHSTAQCTTPHATLVKASQQQLLGRTAGAR